MSHGETTVTNAELRQAMEKLSLAYIKSTAEIGEVLFGNAKTGSMGMIGAEMQMGFSSASMTKSAIDSEATGMMIAGAFTIAAGCLAIAGGGMEAGAIGEEANAASSVEGVVGEGTEPAANTTAELTPAEETGPETSGDGTQLRTPEELREMEEAGTIARPGGEVEMSSRSDTPEDTLRMQERTTARQEEARTQDTRETASDEDTAVTNQEANVDVENASERPTTEARREEMIKEKTTAAKQKQARARSLTMASGAANGLGGIGQAQFKQEQATQQAGAQVRQTEGQAIQTSSQIAQKFYSDLQQGITAAGQTMDLVNQTVVASSRI